MKNDFFIFGSTSDIIQQIIKDNLSWFKENCDTLILIQRHKDIPQIYNNFKTKLYISDCSNAQTFQEQLDKIFKEYVQGDKKVHIFPTYGEFNFNYAKKNPIFKYTQNGLQINLNSRLQIINTFRKLQNPVKFHLFGSLLGNFPYMGDYSLGMWYINQLPYNSEYKELDLIIYNLGGMKTNFWDWSQAGDNPFIHQKIPTKEVFNAGFKNDQKGIVTFYPTFLSRILSFFARKGVRLL